MEKRELTDEQIARSLKTCGKASYCTERCAFYLQNSCIKKMCTEGAKLIRRLKKENAEQKAEIERLTEENEWLKMDVGRFLKKAVFYYRTCQSYGIENFYDEDLEPKSKEGKKITFPKFKDVEEE